MKPVLLRYAVFFLVLCSSILKAQIPVQEWRDHLPYYKGSQIIEGTENVYCLADNNLFYYNKTDRSINKFSKIQGL